MILYVLDDCLHLGCCFEDILTTFLSGLSQSPGNLKQNPLHHLHRDRLFHA